MSIAITGREPHPTILEEIFLRKQQANPEKQSYGLGVVLTDEDVAELNQLMVSEDHFDEVVHRLGIKIS